ncbi:MAG: hypothetical protein ACT4NX_10760 [Deltaproteobacteria bacterium]
MKSIFQSLTLAWAFVVIIGGLMITPDGIVPIVTNPALKLIVGILSIAIGAIGVIQSRQTR